MSIAGIHPSEFITEQMIARGCSAEDLATRMSDGTEQDLKMCRMVLDVYETQGHDEPKLRIAARTAERLGKAFGLPGQHFLDLQDAWLAMRDPTSKE